MTDIKEAQGLEVESQQSAPAVVGWYQPDAPLHITANPQICANWHREGLRVAPVFAATPKAEQPPVALTEAAFGCFVQPVPSHCDRITWRGSYYHLPIASPQPVAQDGWIPISERVAELEADKVRLVEDRARFPDRPDFIGNMIAAHFGNLRAEQAQAQKYADSYRRRMESAERDAAIGAVVWKFIDRMGDHCEVDTAEKILDEFVAAVMPLIQEAIGYKHSHAVMGSKGDE
jgi:hypothetical protein